MDETKSKMAVSRGSLYALLGSVYLNPPDLKSFEKSLDQLLAADQSQGFKLLIDFFEANRNKSHEELQTTVSVEYSRLLLGISQDYGLPPPYESVWMGEGTVMGTLTARVVEMYQKAGVELSADIKEPPDHVGIELGFLSYLCSMEAAAWREHDTDSAVRVIHLESEFLRDHIEAWVPNLCRKIEKEDRTGFYRGIATMTREFLEEDSDELTEGLGSQNEQS
jgi:TorA maturation chaperone TorD